MTLEQTFGVGVQDGWRWCKRCQGLAHSAYGNGVCFDAQGHDFSGSENYSLEVGQAPPPAPDGSPPLSPVIKVSETNFNVTVDGESFTPFGRVAIAFIRGSEVKMTQVTADENGVIYDYERDTEPGDASVIGRRVVEEGRVRPDRALLPSAASRPVRID